MERCSAVLNEAEPLEAVAETRLTVYDPGWAERLKAIQYELSLPKPPRGPRVGDVHPYVKKQIKKVLPALCDALLLKAKEGDVPTMKLLWQMAELDKQMADASTGAKDKRFVRQAIEKYRKR